MMSPLKLSVIVCGAAAGLAVAPYVVKQILPPEGSVEVASSELVQTEDTSVKLDLPVQAPAVASEAAPIAAIPAPQREEPPVRPELHLSAPALPAPIPAAISPAPASEEIALPSLAKPELAAAMPTPKPTSPPAPSPTPEIPYRSDVEEAQKLMRELGLNTGKIDGKLGPNTQAAVRGFQKEQGLTETGDVNADLLSRMEKAVAAIATPTPEPESKIEITDADEPEEKPKKITAAASSKPKIDPGPVPTLQNMKDVRKLQEQLKEAGTYTGDVDGKWGDLTRAAMREFQEKEGIKVTGKPNRETWLAMHNDAPSSEASETAVASADDMKISGIDSEASSEDEELVVNVNGDGVSSPGGAEPIPTPAAVSNLEKRTDDSKPELADNGSSDSPKVKVSTPERESDESSAADDDEPNDMAIAQDTQGSQLEKLRKEIEERRNMVKSVSNDSTYEAKKYAPKMLETVNSMVDDFKIESVSNDPAAARERLAKIDEELEKTKSESMKKKAGQTVSEVEESYKELKEHFPERIKSLSLKDDREKEDREKLTELVAKVDLGYEAMRKDYDNGKYGPIFERGTGFKTTIDEINQAVADAYVASKLEQRDVKKKLSDDELAEIEEMQKDENYLKAAEILDTAVASGSGDRD